MAPCTKARRQKKCRRYLFIVLNQFWSVFVPATIAVSHHLLESHPHASVLVSNLLLETKNGNSLFLTILPRNCTNLGNIPRVPNFPHQIRGTWDTPKNIAFLVDDYESVEVSIPAFYCTWHPKAVPTWTRDDFEKPSFHPQLPD
jgi:hypothetical protein